MNSESGNSDGYRGVNPLREIKKPKTNAQKCKEYRERQKMTKGIELRKKNAQKCKIYRERLKSINSTSNKTSAEYKKEYRRKVKLKNQIIKLNALLAKHHSRKSKKMEISQGQNMQECSSQSGSCNFVNHGSSVKAERGAFAETHGAVAPAALQGCDEVPVAVKLEPDVKDATITEDVEEKYTGSWEDSMADSSLFIKKEHDFVVKMEHETAGVTVKHKLEIEPTVLQSNTAASLHASTPIAQSTSARPPAAAAGPGDGAAPAPFCTVLAQPALQMK